MCDLIDNAITPTIEAPVIETLVISNFSTKAFAAVAQGASVM